MVIHLIQNKRINKFSVMHLILGVVFDLQLYVALSRVGNLDSLRVAMAGDDDHNTCKANNVTANVVYKEALGDCQARK